ncbi:flavodoxin family protein [Knoellia sp. Soil729]|uniref:flavodoxin family protein n=1 Tax=Knoellia sp. Soil729 TaxID=1736394 RepID=UPI0006F4E2A2|nr:flavodoxin domain-containing protein [Knoellia sp. Soil729]KRE42738.1 hypothetical protein ASG74_10200 [Knoellia sp. Soil729]
MTKAWVVYESMYGNTREVADAVAQGVREWADVEVREVSTATVLPDDLDLVVAGAPTHAFGLSRPSTREDAAHKAHRSVESAGMGLREWMDAVDLPTSAPSFVTFDTRVRHPHLPGSAAKKAAKRLHAAGGTQMAKPTSFWVDGMEGPLLEGERERAQAWGASLDMSSAPSREQ